MNHRPAQEGCRVLITAPYGRDAQSMARLLAGEGYQAHILPGLIQVAAAIDDTTGVLLLTEEALSAGLPELAERLAREPPWSDLPVIVLAGRHSAAGNRHEMLRQRLPASMTNTLILERPLSSVSLVSAVGSALLARRRQFAMRDSMASLAESESRLRLATAAADIGTWDFDPVSGALSWDDRCKQLFGLSPTATITYEGSFIAGLHPEDRERAVEAVNAAIAAEGGKYEIEYRIIGIEDGVERWIAAKGSAVFERGQATRFIGTVIDISERKRAELASREWAAALREETEALVLLSEVGQRVAGELDVDRVVQAVCDAGTSLTGARFGAFFYNRVDAAGESYTLYALSGAPHSAFESFAMPRNTAVFAPTFTGEGPVRSDNITTDPRYGRNAPHRGMPAGHLPVVSYLAVPVISRSGEVLGGLFFGHTREAVFNERSERLALGLAAQAAVAIDNARLYGASLSLNETLESRVAERTRALEQEMVRRAATEEALRQSQKMEAVGQLTGGIAHDFNNMLTGVIGSLDAVARRLASGRTDGIAKFMDAARTSAERAAALTSRLLAFSRRQSLDPRSLDINALVASLDDLLRRSLTEKVDFRFTPGEDLPFAVVDGNQLESAILNLSINARDAMPDGGVLEIATHVVQVDGPAPGRTEMRAGAYVAIDVRDTGTGIDPAVLDKVFEPFFTTKPVGQGTGLGLSMVYGFAQQSSGGVQIVSSAEGTCVTILLPVAPAPAMADREDPPVPGGQGLGHTVLLVEDEDAVRLSVIDLLEALDFNVIACADAEAALKHLRSPNDIDLLMTDVGLPGLNGRQLAEMALARQPALSVVFLTGYAEELASRNRLGEGIAVIGKPLDKAQLVSALGQVLAPKA